MNTENTPVVASTSTVSTPVVETPAQVAVVDDFEAEIEARANARLEALKSEERAKLSAEKYGKEARTLGRKCKNVGELIAALNGKSPAFVAFCYGLDKYDLLGNPSEKAAKESAPKTVTSAGATVTKDEVRAALSSAPLKKTIGEIAKVILRNGVPVETADVKEPLASLRDDDKCIGQDGERRGVRYFLLQVDSNAAAPSDAKETPASNEASEQLNASEAPAADSNESVAASESSAGAENTGSESTESEAPAAPTENVSELIAGLTE